jgi:endogenous inhibitor of DNA gyrase (YacG/DUF329 family)
MAETKLKPCPFCKSEGSLLHHLNSHFDKVWAVVCPRCGEYVDNYISPISAA